MQIEYGNWFIRIYKSEDITIEFEKENARNKKEAKREENNQHFSTELSIMMWMVEWMEDLHETARKKNSTKKIGWCTTVEWETVFYMFGFVRAQKAM